MRKWDIVSGTGQAPPIIHALFWVLVIAFCGCFWGAIYHRLVEMGVV